MCHYVFIFRLAARASLQGVFLSHFDTSIYKIFSFLSVLMHVQSSVSFPAPSRPQKCSFICRFILQVSIAIAVFDFNGAYLLKYKKKKMELVQRPGQYV